MLNEKLHIGVIQTSLHAEAAWVDDASGNWRQCVRMSARVQQCVVSGFAVWRMIDRNGSDQTVGLA